MDPTKRSGKEPTVEKEPVVEEGGDALVMAETEIDPIIAASGLVVGEGTITSYVCRQMELANALCIAANLISGSASDQIFSNVNTYIDPVCETLHRLLQRQLPLLIEREPIPRVAASRETLPLNMMMIDERTVNDMLSFLLDNKDVATKIDYGSLVKDLDAWTKKAMEVDMVFQVRTPQTSEASPI